MRVSIVPAQITTVEDKIAGNISVQQAMLLGIPLLFGFITAVVFPPSGQFVAYKMVIVATLFVICGSLAIRVKDRIVAQWLKLFIVYCARPEHYVYNKNSSYLRMSESTEELLVQEEVGEAPVGRPVLSMNHISSKEFTRLEQLAMDSRSSVTFRVGKKGKLNVRITEVK